MYQLQVVKYEELTEKELEKREEARRRDFGYSMNREPFPETFKTRRVLEVNLTDTEYQAIKKSVIESFK